MPKYTGMILTRRKILDEKFSPSNHILSASQARIKKKNKHTSSASNGRIVKHIFLFVGCILHLFKRCFFPILSLICYNFSFCPDHRQGDGFIILYALYWLLIFYFSYTALFSFFNFFQPSF